MNPVTMIAWKLHKSHDPEAVAERITIGATNRDLFTTRIKSAVDTRSKMSPIFSRFSIFPSFRSGLASFSPLGIFSGGLPLPVTLLDFTGQTVPAGNLLKWQTSSEINNDHFVVQRSATGSSFTALGLVAGNGTSSIVNDYQFLDSMPFAGDNFYRLQQVDRNGNSTYSQIVLLAGAGGSNFLTLYPNPAAEVLNIVVPSAVSPGEMQINIYDGMGQLAQSGLYNNTGAVWPLNISLLKPGVYTVVLYQGKTREIGRFIKE